MRKLTLMEEKPFPCKGEAKCRCKMKLLMMMLRDIHKERLQTTVSTSRRDKQAIRHEIVLMAKKAFFLSVWLWIKKEWNDSHETSPYQYYLWTVRRQWRSSRCRIISRGIWWQGCKAWTDISNILESPLPSGNDSGAGLLNTLRRLLPACATAKNVQKTLAALVTLPPHSIQTANCFTSQHHIWWQTIKHGSYANICHN